MNTKSLFLVPRTLTTTGQLDAHLAGESKVLNIEPAIPDEDVTQADLDATIREALNSPVGHVFRQFMANVSKSAELSPLFPELRKYLA